MGPSTMSQQEDQFGTQNKGKHEDHFETGGVM